MDRERSPAWQRLGAVIAKARKNAKMTQHQLAKAMQVVPSTVSAWERGTRGLQEEAARELDRVFGTSGVVLRAWNTANAPTSVPEWYEEVEQLERMVSELREYQSSIVPGLIQVEQYIRALLRDSAPWASKRQLEEMVRSRLKRQDILEKDDPPLVMMVLEPAAIRRVVGTQKILSEQLERILRLIDTGVASVQVMPLDATCHPGGSGPFRIYTFPDKPLVASAEHMWGEKLSDEMIHVQQCVTIFGRLQAEALTPQASRELIRKVKEELDDDQA